MLSGSKTQHGSVDYAYFRMEQLISILMRADSMNLMDQGVLDHVINLWGTLKNVINNEEMPKTVSFVYTGNIGRPSYDVPKEWFRCCLEYGLKQKDISQLSREQKFYSG